MTLDQRPKTDLSSLESVALKEIAFQADPTLNKANAIVELATRAIGQVDLRLPACEAITAERAMPARGPLAIGWPGAVIILDSDQPEFISLLLQAMSQWSAMERRDLLRFFAGKDQFDRYVADLEQTYEWKANLDGA